MQRRPLDPVLTWPAAGASIRYRVSVKNEDTGERRLVYEGPKTICRLPPDLRLCPDQLTFRIAARDPDPSKRYMIQGSWAIDRVGDDFVTPADDLLTVPEAPDAAYYRLQVIDPETGAFLVDMFRAEPAFLLPAGQLAGRGATWRITAGDDPAQRRLPWRPITDAMIEAARARAGREVTAPARVARRAVTTPATTAPGRPSAIAPMASPLTGAYAVPVVLMTVDPLLSEALDGGAMLKQQWGASGPVEVTAGALNRAGLPGLFMVDVFAAEHLGLPVARRLLTNRYADRRLELYFNPSRWLQAAGEPMDVASSGAFTVLLDRARRLFEDLVGRPPTAVRLADDVASESNLMEVEAAGFALAVLGPEAEPHLPSWMQQRQAPVVVGERLVVVPAASVVSQPAHPRDRPLRHRFGSERPLVATVARSIGAVAARAAEKAAVLLLTEIDPLSLIQRRKLVDAAKAQAWNTALSRDRPAWADMGWERSERGFDVAGGSNEAAVERLTALLAGLGGGDVQATPPDLLFSPDFLRAVSELRRFEPVVEVRRGPRVARLSAVRLYDAALRQALSVELS